MQNIEFLSLCNGRWPIEFQALAALANNLVSLNNGLFDGFPSIVIPSLIGLNKELNPNETLRITSQQASWIGNDLFSL